MLAALALPAPARRLGSIPRLGVAEGISHEDRVGQLTHALALALQFDADKAELLGAAAVLHDVGSTTIPAAILHKPAPLDADEWEIMRSHSRRGHQVLAGNRHGLLATAAAIALSHHEAYDGSGYPQGLRGEAIPLPSRIVALADVYAALREVRPYRKPVSHEAATAIILNGDDRAGPGKFDPAVLEAFRRAEPAFDLIVSGDIN
jgi:putative two-component system response regulator